MFSIFKNYIQSRVNITEDELKIVESFCIVKKVHKRQFLLQEGDVWRNYAFVLQGCLRTYRIDEKGTEHILNFAIESWWIGDRESLLTGVSSKYNIDAIENSIVLLMNKADFEQSCKSIPAMNEMVMGISENSFIASQKRIHVAISYTAQEKYLNFIEQYPNLALRVPQHMIASYLGISPETLSRVRSQLGK